MKIRKFCFKVFIFLNCITFFSLSSQSAEKVSGFIENLPVTTKSKPGVVIPFKDFDSGYENRLNKKNFNIQDIKEGYKDYRLNEIYLKNIAKEFSDIVSYHEIGRTRFGNPIPAILIGKNSKEYKTRALFSGGVHPAELISTEHCYDIIYFILTEQEKYKKVLEKLSIWIVPIVNPDGSFLFWHKSHFMGRKNGYLAKDMREDDSQRGVDLNRNYPFMWGKGGATASSSNPRSNFFRGEFPASEPETLAMMELAERERFSFSISFHTFACKLLFPYTIEGVKNPEPDYVKNLAHTLASLVQLKRAGKTFLAKKNIYPVDGTDQDYYYHKFGTNALILESSHLNVDYKNIAEILQGFRPLWERLLEEALVGFRIRIKVLDVKGNLISAKVEFPEIKFFEKEEFLTDPKTGVFEKFFLEDGPRKIIFSKEGYFLQEIVVTPERGEGIHEVVVKEIR